ncbi:hypothetical protein GCK32_001259 [Trichostrongylus colubriformis]|uniref:Uncharacterized protein n=1 Tax=Trichostrongylus colubriformis TaxID=6319 RepID=A0AAN8F7Y6_TRICO
MQGDCAYQPSVLGEVGTSPLTSLSRRSTFDEDLFFSPIKPKPEERASRTGLSPQQVQKLPTIQDNVLKWFLEMIDNRRLRVSACASVICAFLFFVSLIVLQFSLRSPLRFFSDAFSSTFSLSTWFSCIIIGSLSFGVCWVLLNCLAKAEQLHKVPWTSTDAWICFCTVLFHDVIHSFALMKMTGFPMEEKFLVGLILQSVIMSAFSSIFRNDFQLNFSGAVTQLGLVHTIVGMFAVCYESVLVSSFREAVLITSITTVIGCIAGKRTLGVFAFGFSSLLILFNISFHMYSLIIVFGQLFATKALLKLVRHIVMKLFAFTDLRRVAWTDRNRRMEVFSLSQPGSALLCTKRTLIYKFVFYLKVASSRFENFGLDKAAGDVDDDSLDVDREMLMMPHKARKQIYSSAVRQRHRVALRPIALQPTSALKQQSYWWRRVILYSTEQEIISRYDANIAILAIESLYMFVVESYSEDRYGVVLKDLNAIIGVFVQLIQTIDRYFRLRANQTFPSSGCDSPVKQIDAALQTSLIRISGKFGGHLK